MYEPTEQEQELLDRAQEHCPNGHWFITGLTFAEAQELYAVLRRLHGLSNNKGVWWKSTAPGVYSCEFFKRQGYRYPWARCGRSALFEDWRARENERATLKATFRVGQRVTFTHAGITYHGVVAGGRQRATVLVDNDEPGRKWHVPYRDLTKI